MPVCQEPSYREYIYSLHIRVFFKPIKKIKRITIEYDLDLDNERLWPRPWKTRIVTSGALWEHFYQRRKIKKPWRPDSRFQRHFTAVCSVAQYTQERGSCRLVRGQLEDTFMWRGVRKQRVRGVTWLPLKSERVTFKHISFFWIVFFIRHFLWISFSVVTKIKGASPGILCSVERVVEPGESVAGRQAVHRKCCAHARYVKGAVSREDTHNYFPVLFSFPKI